MMGNSHVPVGAIAVLLSVAGTFSSSAVELGRALISSGLTNPVFITAPPGDTSRIFVAEQDGRIKIITLANNTVLSTPFLDISSRVDSFRNEQGLLGMAFHPDFTNNGYFYLNYIFDLGGDSDLTRISRFQANGPPYSTAVTADSNSETILLTYNQPQSNHNAGMLAFEPRSDGKAYLYIASGDGGGGGDDDAGHNASIGNGQDRNTLLGKILRIDVDEGGEGAGTGGANYDIPPTNPDMVGLPEIWSYGLRNPYRFGFDRENGDLYIADVGQFIWEEINHRPGSSTGGENYGWRLMEGPDCFNPSSNCDPGGLTDPVFSYDHDNDDGIAVIGGYPYRGSAIPFIEGHYIFADANPSTNVAKTFLSNGTSATLIQDWASELQTSNITTFGEDATGEIYFAIRSGFVYKIIPTNNGLIRVDFAASGLMKGNFDFPFDEVDTAVRSVSDGGLIVINGASTITISNETMPLTIDRAMTIAAVNGTVQIGTSPPAVRKNNSEGFVTRP